METFDVVGSIDNVDEIVDLIESDDNINVCTTENEDWTIVSKGSCESVDNIAAVESVVPDEAVESLRKTVEPVYTDAADGSDDKGTVDSVERNDDVGSIKIEYNIVDSASKYETVCAVESDTIDGVFDNEDNIVSSVDNNTTVSKTECDKVELINDAAAVDVENNTDAINLLTNDGIMDLVYIADVVDSVNIDVDGSKSVDTCNDDEF